MTGKPDAEKVEIIVDKVAHIIRAHIRAGGGSVESIREGLNGLAAVAAMVVGGAPTSTQSFDFFLDAFRQQVAAEIEHKMNPQPKPPRIET